MSYFSNIMINTVLTDFSIYNYEWMDYSVTNMLSQLKEFKAAPEGH